MRGRKVEGKNGWKYGYSVVWVIQCAGVWWFERMVATLPNGAFCGGAGGAAPLVQPRAVV